MAQDKFSRSEMERMNEHLRSLQQGVEITGPVTQKDDRFTLQQGEQGELEIVGIGKVPITQSDKAVDTKPAINVMNWTGAKPTARPTTGSANPYFEQTGPSNPGLQAKDNIQKAISRIRSFASDGRVDEAQEGAVQLRRMLVEEEARLMDSYMVQAEAQVGLPAMQAELDKYAAMDADYRIRNGVTGHSKQFEMAQSRVNAARNAAWTVAQRLVAQDGEYRSLKTDAQILIDNKGLESAAAKQKAEVVRKLTEDDVNTQAKWERIGKVSPAAQERVLGLARSKSAEPIPENEPWRALQTLDPVEQKFAIERATMQPEEAAEDVYNPASDFHDVAQRDAIEREMNAAKITAQEAERRVAGYQQFGNQLLQWERGLGIGADLEDVGKQLRKRGIDSITKSPTWSKYAAAIVARAKGLTKDDKSIWDNQIREYRNQILKESMGAVVRNQMQNGRDLLMLRPVPPVGLDALSTVYQSEAELGVNVNPQMVARRYLAEVYNNIPTVNIPSVAGSVTNRTIQQRAAELRKRSNEIKQWFTQFAQANNRSELFSISGQEMYRDLLAFQLQNANSDTLPSFIESRIEQQAFGEEETNQ